MVTKGQEVVDSGLLVLYERLDFAHQVSGQSQDLLHVVAISHFWKETLRMFRTSTLDNSEISISDETTSGHLLINMFGKKKKRN